LSRLSVFLFGRCREPCADAQPLPDRKGLRSRSDRRRHRVHRGPCASECDQRAVSGIVGRCGHRACRARFRQLRPRQPSRIRFARCQAVSLSPQHPHRVPTLCDCQHAHDLWRSTDTHQGSVRSAGRSCLRSLEFVFSHHCRSQRNKPTGDVGSFAALAALDNRAEIASMETLRAWGFCVTT